MVMFHLGAPQALEATGQRVEIPWGSPWPMHFFTDYSHHAKFLQHRDVHRLHQNSHKARISLQSSC